MAVVYKSIKPILHTVEEEKNELAIKVLSLKDKSIVHIFKLILEDLTASTKKTSRAKYNKEIDAAVKRVRGGKSVSNNVVMNEMDKW